MEIDATFGALRILEIVNCYLFIIHLGAVMHIAKDHESSEQPVIFARVYLSHVRNKDQLPAVKEPLDQAHRARRSRIRDYVFLLSPGRAPRTRSGRDGRMAYARVIVASPLCTFMNANGLKMAMNAHAVRKR